jgi:hypothetical protein
MGDVTRDELRDLREDLVERMSSGFAGVHSRLDVLNGRTGKGEVAVGEAAVRLAHLEHEVFRRRRGKGDGSHVDHGSHDLAAMPITFGSLDWLVKFGGWVAAAGLGLLKLTGHL